MPSKTKKMKKSYNQFLVPFNQMLQAMFQPMLDINGESPYYIEVYHFENEPKRVKTKTFKLHTVKFETITGIITGFNELFDSYFSVCPRDYHFQHDEYDYDIRSTNSNVSVGCMLWLDIDGKNLAEDIEEGKTLALARIQALEPIPNIIVDSGNGYHVYYLLDQAYLIKQVSQTVKRVEKWLGADACHDPARMLRVPGSINRKDPSNPKKSKIIHFDNSKRYTLEEFDHFPEVDLQNSAYHMIQIQLPSQSNNIDLNQVKSRFVDQKLEAKILAPTLEDYREVLGQRKLTLSRSERDFHVCCQLLKSDFTPEEIQSIFNKYPVGDKYHEKGTHGDSYLRHTIESAIRAIEEEKKFQVTIVQKSNAVQL